MPHMTVARGYAAMAENIDMGVANTKKSTKLWINCFNEYLMARNLRVADDIDVDLLLDILESFYSEVQKKTEQKRKRKW